MGNHRKQTMNLVASCLTVLLLNACSGNVRYKDDIASTDGGVDGVLADSGHDISVDSVKYIPKDIGPNTGSDMRMDIVFDNKIDKGMPSNISFQTATAEYDGTPGANTNPLLAIDGNDTTVYGSGVGIHADSQQWWQGDLGKAVFVKNIEFLWMQTKAYASCIKTISIELSLTGNFAVDGIMVVSGYKFDADGKYRKINTNVSTRYIKLHYFGSCSVGHGLDLVEIKAFGP